MDALKTAVLKVALERGHWSVVATAVAMGFPPALALPDSVKKRAIRSLL